jgi:hypothetical protein
MFYAHHFRAASLIFGIYKEMRRSVGRKVRVDFVAEISLAARAKNNATRG